jgi:hypothetical protein
MCCASVIGLFHFMRFLQMLLCLSLDRSFHRQQHCYFTSRSVKERQRYSNTRFQCCKAIDAVDGMVIVIGF